MKKKKDIKLALILLGIFAVIFFMRVKIVTKVIPDTKGMYDVISDAIVHNKTSIYFTSEESPDDLDYEGILDVVMAKDMYSGGEFYEYKYSYKINSDGNYKVKFKVKKPRWYRKYFAKKRVKKIAKAYRGLGSDYEKIKAVHDYICSYNAYQRISGGAYMTICNGNAACNGYGLAFYEVMTELGIPVTYECGNNHMWNRVMVDGKWYNIDLTWDDPGRGEVRYDYFLKCDAHWGDHDFGGSDADKSLTVRGLSAKEYYKMVPNHKITRWILFIIFGGIAGVIIFYLSVKVPQKMKLKKQKEQELLEKSIRQSRELAMLDRQLNMDRDDY